MPNRMTLVQALTGAGPVTLGEAARRVGRDVRAVRGHQIEFPYTALHIDFMAKAAA